MNQFIDTLEFQAKGSKEITDRKERTYDYIRSKNIAISEHFYSIHQKYLPLESLKSNACIIYVILN